MAGIGFELYKILHKGTLSSIVQAFFLGIIIVAGPWILSVLTIYIIQTYSFEAISSNPALFTVTIVYVYAFSLFLSGGFHYVFSRYIADQLYIENYREIPSALLTAIILISIISVVPVSVFILFNNFSFVPYHTLYILSLIALFIIINILWIMLVYIALLKAYYKIFFSYLAGTIASIAGVKYLGKIYGISGALCGYTIGQAIIVILLIIISQLAYPIQSLTLNREFISSFKEHKRIFLMGLLFNMAIWSDKMLYWFLYGNHIPNTLYYYYIPYDIPVFLAYLTMIPGLVYFLIIAETDFHKNFFEFISNILQDPFRYIQSKKQKMLISLQNGIKGIVFFQSIWTVGILIKLPQILDFLGYAHTINLSIMRILLIAVFFHLLTLNCTIYLLYMELQFEAAMAAGIYLLCNVVLTLVSMYAIHWLPGTSYMIASIVSTVYCTYHLYKKAPIIDFIIFSRT
ncbi:MAG: exopolysaccharide Pel transporter PelG [Spirochaetes bacterium]|nr:exopolysaccharide Pel transporter PelG [Spirochaetota bacterium]